MFTVTVRDHMMIAHSLRGESFGPAQRLHGATYVVDAAFESETTDADGVVVDIDAAARSLHDVLADFTLHNLDEDPSLQSVNTTTEQLARVVADRLADRIGRGELGESAHRIDALTVTLHESHVAWASYRRSL